MIEPEVVFDWLGITDPTEDQLTAMSTVVLAVYTNTAKTYTAPDPDTDADWELGHTILAARLWQRKKSPAGVIDLGEFGGIRVSAIDRDAEKLLSSFLTIVFA